MKDRCSKLSNNSLLCVGDMETNMVIVDHTAIDASLPPVHIQVKPRLLLITHGHADHFRYAHEYKSMGLLVAAPRHCIPLIENPAINQMATIGWAGPIDEKLVTRYFIGKGVRVDTPLEPGRINDSIEAIAAPGHTPGHLVYLVETSDPRILVAGDTVLGHDYLEKNPLPYHTSTIWLEGSLNKIKSLNADILVPGHGEPATGKRELLKLVDRNLSKIQESLSLVEKNLPRPDEQPIYTDEVVARIAETLGLSHSKRAYSALSPTVRALLLALKHMGRAETITRRGVLAWRRAQNKKHRPH